jgi:hypothetical protein
MILHNQYVSDIGRTTSERKMEWRSSICMCPFDGTVLKDAVTPF